MERYSDRARATEAGAGGGTGSLLAPRSAKAGAGGLWLTVPDGVVAAAGPMAVPRTACARTMRLGEAVGTTESAMANKARPKAAPIPRVIQPFRFAAAKAPALRFLLFRLIAGVWRRAPEEREAMLTALR